MPNHVITRCEVTGPVYDIDKFFRLHWKQNQDTNKDDWFLDFNTIIPMPDILRDTEEGYDTTVGNALIDILNDHSCCILDSAHERARHMVGCRIEERGLSSVTDAINEIFEEHPEYLISGRRAKEAIAMTGYSSWYHWAVAHWDTKWNSYWGRRDSPDTTEFHFYTAWAMPLPIFHKLAEMYPKLSFWLYTFDEGWGFAGRGVIGNLDTPGAYPFDFCDATEELYELAYKQTAPIACKTRNEEEE